MAVVLLALVAHSEFGFEEIRNILLEENLVVSLNQFLVRLIGIVLFAAFLPLLKKELAKNFFSKPSNNGFSFQNGLLLHYFCQFLMLVSLLLVFAILVEPAACALVLINDINAEGPPVPAVDGTVPEQNPSQENVAGWEKAVYEHSTGVKIRVFQEPDGRILRGRKITVYDYADGRKFTVIKKRNGFGPRIRSGKPPIYSKVIGGGNRNRIQFSFEKRPS